MPVGSKKAVGQYLVINNTHWLMTMLVVAMETTAANQHDSQPMLDVLDKARIKVGSRLHGDKAYWACRIIVMSDI